MKLLAPLYQIPYGSNHGVRFIRLPMSFIRAYFVRNARRLFILLSNYLLMLSGSMGQPPTTVRPIINYVEGGYYAVSGPVPFWLRANQSGVVPLAGSTGMLRLGVAADYQPVDSLRKKKKVDWGFGLELIGRAGQQRQLLLPEAYLKVRWGTVELAAGRRRSIAGLVDTLLTSGAYAWSGNAMPIPTIQLGTRGFVAVPLTKGFMALNSFFNHGWFENVNKKVLNTRLHQCALYLRLGKSASKVNVYGGFTHQVVWGGYAAYLPNNVSNNGQLPSSLKAYLYAITGLAYPTSEIDANVSSIDEGNRIGNHLGSLDLGLQLNLAAGRLLLYRQNPYDTGALYYLTSIADGLNGISFRRRQPGAGWLSVEQGLLEWLFTKSQGGSLFIIGNPYTQGKVNYFNNMQYIDGWQYFGRTIGTPFLTPQTEVNPSLPVGYVIANNRVSLWHVGLSGRVGGRLNWLAKLSFSQNLGTYDIPYPVGTHQFSALLTLNGPLKLPGLKNCQFTASAGLDAGKLFRPSNGLYLGLRKPFFGGTTSRSSSPSSRHRQPMLGQL